MAKVIFVLHRRADLTREQCLEHWSSEQHTSILKTVPGVSRLCRISLSPLRASQSAMGSGALV